MRGCLFVLLLAAAFVGGGLWFGGPPAAGYLIEAGLTSGGLRAEAIDVTVDTEPRWEVVTGRVDRVEVIAVGASLGDVEAGAIDVDLTGVDLGGRSFEAVSGTLDEVNVPGESAAVGPASVELEGRAEAARAIVNIPAFAVEELITSAIEAETGRAVDRVTLVAPDRIAFRLSGVDAEMTLSLEDGRVVGRTNLGGQNVTLFDPAESLALQLDDLRVDEAGLTLSGVLDFARLLGG
jgi:hypothetical protein